MLLLTVGVMLLATLGSSSIKSSLVTAQFLKLTGTDLGSGAATIYIILIAGLFIKSGVGPFFF